MLVTQLSLSIVWVIVVAYVWSIVAPFDQVQFYAAAFAVVIYNEIRAVLELRFFKLVWNII